MAVSHEIKDFDQKIRVSIGELLRKADSVSKSVISAFDPSKDLNVNKSVLGGPRFNSPALETCAKFLNIPLQSNDGNKIFTNKPSLANRIILEIKSFYPAICGECSEEYTVKHRSSDVPCTLPIRCFLCFQGCHMCDFMAASLADISNPLPIGLVWLCYACYEINNPVKIKKTKSKAPSKASSRAPSATTTPRSEQQAAKISTAELVQKLQAVSQQQQQQQAQEETSPATDSSNTPDVNSQQLSAQQTQPPEAICELFKEAKCPHGVSGKTLVNGKQCTKFHPRHCRRFARNGTDRKYGCRKGDGCSRFHPKHCSSSLQNKTCFNADCTLVHLVGTARNPRPSGDTRPPDRPQGSDRRDTYRRPNPVNRQSTKPLPRSRPLSEPANTRSSQPPPAAQQPSVDHFLELRSLLTTFQSNFQEEIKSLKTQIQTQENKLTSLLHSSSQQMYPHPPTAFQTQGQIPQFLRQPPMIWPQYPVSGC